MSLDCERPESYLGMLMALEGVSDGFTIIHGPTGCKYYPASVSETAFPDRGGEVKARNLFRYSCKYFFSQPHIIAGTPLSVIQRNVQRFFRSNTSHRPRCSLAR